MGRIGNFDFHQAPEEVLPSRWVMPMLPLRVVYMMNLVGVEKRPLVMLWRLQVKVT